VCGPVISSHDLPRSLSVSWPSVCNFTVTSVFGSAIGSEPTD
jgi:hypothetical protein